MLQKIITVVQLAQPHIHRINVYECAICTFKKKISISFSRQQFPIHMWCRIVKQSEIPMNLQLPSRTTQGYQRMRKSW